MFRRTAGRARPPVGWHDHFSDPQLNGHWVDAHTLYPTAFSPTVVDDHAAEFLGTHTNTYPWPSEKPWLLVSHFLCWQDLGITTGFELGIEFRCDEFFHMVQQVSPALFCDPSPGDPLAMGLVPIWDVSIPAMGFQNVFRNDDQGEVFDSSYYRILSSEGEMLRGGSFNPEDPPSDEIPEGSIVGKLPPTYGPGVTHTMAARVEDGEVGLWFDGELVVGPHPVPAQFASRTLHGFHCIAIGIAADHAFDDGDAEWLPPQPARGEVIPSLVERWWCERI